MTQEELQATLQQLKRLTDSLADVAKRFEELNANIERLNLYSASYKDEIAKMQKKLVAVKMKECLDCGGTGLSDPGYHNVGPGQCSNCGGTGKVIA
jgi:hypothetical protein